MGGSVRSGKTVGDLYFGLARLLHPMDFRQFLQENWERKPLLVQREDRGYFSDLMTLEDFDAELNLAGGNLDHLRVVQDGKETQVAELGAGSSLTAMEAVYARYREGATLVMNSVQDRFPSVNALMRALGSEIGARVQVNSYLTPSSARGFSPHYDMHDVFVVQVHGTKRWQLFDSPMRLPLRSQPYDRSQPEPALLSEFELSPGDVLYLPRGTVHAATSCGEASLHLTVGIHPQLWGTVLLEAVHRLVEREERFRAGLPVGYTGSEEAQEEARRVLSVMVAELPTLLDTDEMVTRAVSAGVSANAPALLGHLPDLERLDSIEDSTEVRRRLPIQWNISADESGVRLDFHGKTVTFPPYVAEEVRFAARRSSGVFTAAALPGELDGPGRLVLVRKLVGEGFLTLA